MLSLADLKVVHFLTLTFSNLFLWEIQATIFYIGRINSYKCESLVLQSRMKSSSNIDGKEGVLNARKLKRGSKILSTAYPKILGYTDLLNKPRIEINTWDNY